MEDLEKEFVPYPFALRMKALGYDEPCFGWFTDFQRLYIDKIINGKIFNSNNGCLAPTFSQAFRWFRKKGYDTKVQKESKSLYLGFYWTGVSWITIGVGSYEEAELACLEKLLEIVEQKEK